ncbi:MAG TPA: hypothetical protein VI815_02295 [Candidatus Nanoarchaeia archaeon]|nr:hypothetical protein [Candidatus Nanoarchaeia archaeon]
MANQINKKKSYVSANMVRHSIALNEQKKPSPIFQTEVKYNGLKHDLKNDIKQQIYKF